MPERPDLEYVIPILDRELRGQMIAEVRVKKPVVLRLLLPGTPAKLLNDKTIAAVRRRGHFVLFDLVDEDVLIAVHPMLAGRFVITSSKDRAPADVAVALTLSDGRELRYRDDVQMGKFYLLAANDWRTIPGLAEVGVDVLSAEFTRERFRELAKNRRDQVKVFLLDKSALDSFGNAYADEVLWHAQIHPKTMVRSLADTDLDRLHDAIVTVLTHARDEIARRKPATDEKLRDFLAVRGRNGEPCKRCGTKLRRARVHSDDSIFCPRCQPDVRGSSIVDWRKIQP